MKPLIYTAIPYRASTGPEQGIPCVVFPHMEKPVFISWYPCNGNRFFPVGNTTQGKPCFHYRDGFAVYIHINLIHKQNQKLVTRLAKEGYKIRKILG
jgi:hypothetical protein